LVAPIETFKTHSYLLSKFPLIQSLCKKIWHSYFKKTVDNLQPTFNRTLEEIKKHFFSSQWNEVYDLIEFIAQNYEDNSHNKDFIKFCNHVFERELSGYRFIDGVITSIVSEVEISSIESALKTKYDPVNEHLKRSLELLSDRKNPDYRNSIKEAISAVESLAKLITGNEKVELGTALKELAKTHSLHPALKEAFQKLYGYTSDADGIRHALLDEDQLNFDDAKFMLVACSAFVNYVIAKMPATS
jgi:hypothetical protein